MIRYSADVIVIGAGIAGVTAAIELLNRGRRVLLLDRDSAENMGGLAKESFGGIWFAGGSFGITWKLTQAVLKPKPSLRGKCHIQLDDDEQRRISVQSKPHHDEDHATSAATAQEVDVEDSDEEEEDSAPLQRTASSAPVVAAAAASAVTAPKKIVAKKK